MDSLSLCVFDEDILTECFAHYLTFHDLLRLRAVCREFREKTKIVTQRIVRRFWECRIEQCGSRCRWLIKCKKPFDDSASPYMIFYEIYYPNRRPLDTSDIELDQDAPITSYMALRKQFSTTHPHTYVPSIEKEKKLDFPLEPVKKKLKK